MRWPFVSRRERLRREAADWIARLNGPHDEQDRAAFRQWYHSDPDRARAYDRLSALFETAGELRRPQGAEVGARSRSRPLRYAFAAAVACAAVIAFFLLSARTIIPGAEPRQQFATFAADGAEGRRVVLEEGSEVHLSRGSRLEVAIGPTERRLRLLAGQGRFAVARESRPFIVEASGTEVVARGTVFLIHVADGRTTVSLIEGRVDVSYPQPSGRPGGRRVTRLAPGERLVVDSTPSRAVMPAPAAPVTVETRARASSPAMLEFDDAPLEQAVAQINRRGRPPIRLGDSGIGRLRVTGAFRPGDTTGFAESVSAAFGLEVRRGPDGSLWLRRSSEAAE